MSPAESFVAAAHNLHVCEAACRGASITTVGSLHSRVAACDLSR